MSGEPKNNKKSMKEIRSEILNSKDAPMLSSMVISGFIVGYILDLIFGTNPVFLLGCAVLGFVGGMMNSYGMLGKENKNGSLSDSSEGNDPEKDKDARQ